jgi:membrane-bound lytic murein transglycosylase D
MKNYQTPTLVLAIFFIALLFGSLPADAETVTEPEPFPMYDSIRANVSFWEKIYSKYSTTQGVIHDKQNLDIIYDVIELKDRNLHGSQQINRTRIKEAKQKYRKILDGLARGESPVGGEEHRVAALFGPEAKPGDFQSAIRNLRCQVGQKDPFRQGIIRSGAYLEEIMQIFREHGLPADLAYLPHVESSFNPKAYSKFGAAGIWQFTRTTGKHYMTVGYAVDERRDPIFSSHAAAKLLKRNFKKFQSWPMAITAYNHGVAGMLRAQRRKGSYEAIFNEYRSRTFKFASRNFYSEFLAARKIARNYRQYFGELVLDRPSISETVVLDGYGALPEIARQLKLELGDLAGLNPALRDPVLKGQKYVPRGFHLRLPAPSDRDWQSVMAELAPKIFHDHQQRSQIYTVRPGDTAGEIASMHGVDLSDLIAANNLDSRATIYARQNLRIPQAGETLAVLKSEPAKAKMASVRPEETFVPLPETIEVRSEAPLQPPAAHLDFDTIESNRVVEAAIARMESETSETGETPAADSPLPRQPSVQPIQSPDAVLANLGVENLQHDGSRQIGRIQVQVEETLGHYAEWLEISAGEIRRLNGFRYGKPIRINQSILIPLQRVSKEAFEEKRFEFHKELAEDFFTTYRVEKVQTYTVKKGDNIWTLSRDQFEVPLWLIKKYNAHLDFHMLRPSQKLLIPIIEKNQV